MDLRQPRARTSEQVSMEDKLAYHTDSECPHSFGPEANTIMHQRTETYTPTFPIAFFRCSCVWWV